MSTELIGATSPRIIITESTQPTLFIEKETPVADRGNENNNSSNWVEESLKPRTKSLKNRSLTYNAQISDSQIDAVNAVREHSRRESAGQFHTSNLPERKLKDAMSIKIPDPSFYIQEYLGVQLDGLHKYIKVSKEKKTISSEKSLLSDDHAKIQKQIHLFNTVIAKLTNTTGYKLYISTDLNVDAKAEIITAVFFKRCQTSVQLQAFHRNALANALTFHLHTYLINPSLQASEKPQISLQKTEFTPVDETTTSSSPPKVIVSKETHRKISDSSSSPKSELGKKLKLDAQFFASLTSSSNTEDKKVVEQNPMHAQSDPIPITPKKRDSSPRKVLNRSLKDLDRFKDRSSHIHHRDHSSSKEIHLEKTENEPEFITKHLSLECLCYCHHYWTYLLTNDENNKYLMETCEKKITLCDRTHLSNSHFLDKPKLKWVLQDLSIRALTDAIKQKEFPADINRTFEYVEMWDINNMSLFRYKNRELIEQELIAKHSCIEFAEFLVAIIKKLEGRETSYSHPILQIWKTCVAKVMEKEITNSLFEETVVHFLHEIADHSRMQEEKGIKYQLGKLLSPLYQPIYTTPCKALISSLPRIVPKNKISNRCNRIKFISLSKVEVSIKNTIQFSKGKCIDFIHLEMENKLTTDLSEFTPWSSEITVHIRLSPEANKNKVDELVIKPLQKIGIDVYQSRSRTPKKSNTDTSYSPPKF